MHGFLAIFGNQQGEPGVFKNCFKQIPQRGFIFCEENRNFGGWIAGGGASAAPFRKAVVSARKKEQATHCLRLSSVRRSKPYHPTLAPNRRLRTSAPFDRYEQVRQLEAILG
jgi:hypothetical protein